MTTLRVDGRAVTVPAGTTILQAARRVGIEIPTLCYQEGCRAETSCLVCVVGLNGSQRLVPSCATVAQEGMEVESETPRIHAARRTALELLLGDHLGDCVGPCRVVCPARMDIPRMIRLISAGRMAEAVAVVREHIPLPAVLGRICPELCEKGCRRSQVDGPVAIRLLKRQVGDWALQHPEACPPVRGPATGRRVAIVGAGPAGLAAAFYLNRAGHECTLLDDQPRPGGMLRRGPDEAALPREVLDAEVDAILAEGIGLRAPVVVGLDVTLDELRREHDAVVVAVGGMPDGNSGALGLPVEGAGLRADRETQMTDLPGVFVAGSAQSPVEQAVRAVAGGHSAAVAVGEWLAGLPVRGLRRPYSVHMGKLAEADLAAFARSAPAYPRLAPQGGERMGFSEVEARAEADRCLRCDCAGRGKCRLRKWAARYEARPGHYHDRRRTFARDETHPEVSYEPGKCIACGLCIQVAAQHGEELGLSFVGRGFPVRVGVPFAEPLREGLKVAARACAQVCPTGALVARQ